jgi:hypothetical protein
MAARYGHLELCRFLLRETSLSADNAVLGSALERVQWHAWFDHREPSESLLAAFYQLFVGEHNLEIDLLNHHTFEDFYQLIHTKTSFGVVLASQPTPFADLSLAQKFSATIEAVGWPADTFATMLHSHDPTEVVTQTTEEGKTALHWAAAHIGEWLSRFKNIHGSPYFSRKIESYEQLASDLIRMGANVHALWHEEIAWSSGIRSFRNYDPFLSLFKGVDIKSRYHWDQSCMAQAVSLWGRVLVEGGVNLHEYIVTENEFLKSIEWSDIDIPSSPAYNGRLDPAKLFLRSDSTLAVIIRDIPCVTVWKARATHVPGAWPASPLIVDTIVWLPGATDESYGFEWAPSDTIEVNTKPGLNQIDAPDMSSGSDELLHDLIIDAEPRHSRSHDDHGTVAMVLSHEIRSRQQVSWRHSSGPRASSAPPPQDYKARLGADWTNRAVYMPSGWRFTLHKCPLDLRWHKRSLCLSFSDCRRDCMQERCHDLRISDREEYSNTFEWWFLRNEGHVHVAKRYAQKFCPEQLHIVEATLERVTDRARLAMGPKRPEDARMP